MPTPSKRYVNCTANFTPAAGTLTPITGLQRAAPNQGISRIKESGDADVLPTVAFSDYADPTIDLETLDAFALESSLYGVIGTLVVTIPDARNGVTAGGGGMTITMVNASVQASSATHTHRQFGRRTLTFGGYSTDGQTAYWTTSAL
jgi:hypothetical protein